MSKHNMFLRRQTGKLKLLPAAQTLMKRRVAYLLRKLAQNLQNGTLNEDNVDNADETHFAITVENGRTLGFRGHQDV